MIERLVAPSATTIVSAIAWILRIVREGRE